MVELSNGNIDSESHRKHNDKEMNLRQAFITVTPMPLIWTSVHRKCEVVVLNQKDQEHSKVVEQLGHLYHFDRELGSRHCKRKRKKLLSKLRFSN